jgi:hypothetical protein
MKCLELLYRVYPEVLDPLPVNEIRTELDFYRPIRLQFQTYGPCTAIHVNNHHLGVKSFLIYPDMEIEPLQHLFTNEELKAPALHHDKFELWQD